MDRLRQQVDFIVEIDKLKTITRRSYITDGSRFENDAEHSWYFAMIAMVLGEHVGGDVDVDRVMKMALVHDIVEIDAGDVILYDEAARTAQAEREAAAARRIFSILPPDQAHELAALWREFEAGQTPESRYARAVDRFSSIVLNYSTGGRSWREHGITREQVKRLNRDVIEGVVPALWSLVEKMIDETFGPSLHGPAHD
jgi:putative hydrolase of HD superfamily